MKCKLVLGDFAKVSSSWCSPTAIVSDGAYGVSGFDGDPENYRCLPDWYEPYISIWSSRATYVTTLWFWNTEIGWATVHPILEKYGWIYKSLSVWDKGIAHIAGNVNGNTIKGFPVVTEVCARYVRETTFSRHEKSDISFQKYMIEEWKRTKIPIQKSNEASGVKNAATRKYFTESELWYQPPKDKMKMIVDYANKYGEESGRPYFCREPDESKIWQRNQYKWNHLHGITNVWSEPSLRNDERVKGEFHHPNQKPLKLMTYIIKSSTDEGDVVWEPFGGLFTASLCSVMNNRISYASEVNKNHYEAGVSRMRNYFDSNKSS